MSRSTLPRPVEVALTAYAEASEQIGYCTAFGVGKGSLYSPTALDNAKRARDGALLRLKEAIQAYGSQLYEGGIELGRSEGAK